MTDDLLGFPLEDPPPMTAPLPWRIFKVSDEEWYVARSLVEAKLQAASDWGYQPDDAEFLEQVEDAYELTDEQMAVHKFYDEETGARVTFAEELNRWMHDGLTAPNSFASSEY